jgi:hypothetical protein
MGVRGASAPRTRAPRAATERRKILRERNPRLPFGLNHLIERCLVGRRSGTEDLLGFRPRRDDAPRRRHGDQHGVGDGRRGWHAHRTLRGHGRARRRGCHLLCSGHMWQRADQCRERKESHGALLPRRGRNSKAMAARADPALVREDASGDRDDAVAASEHATESNGDARTVRGHAPPVECDPPAHLDGSDGGAKSTGAPPPTMRRRSAAIGRRMAKTQSRTWQEPARVRIRSAADVVDRAADRCDAAPDRRRRDDGPQ